MSRRPDVRAIAVAVALLCLTAACERRRNGAEVDGGAGSDAGAADGEAGAAGGAGAADGEAGAGGAADVAFAFGCDETSPPRSGRSVGHTSVVFKVDLASGRKAAWKPDARKVHGRYRGEIAAYRLATALGLPNVPPACARTFARAEVRAALGGNAEALRLLDDEVVVEPDGIHGAVIPWIDGLRFWSLEKEPLRSEVNGWLGARPIAPENVDLARQASMLVAFDFITGNWDRYSGGNVGLDRTGTHVLFIDNDASFMERPPRGALVRNEERLRATNRFSRSFVRAVRALDGARLRAALGEEGAGRPLVPDAVVELVERRIHDLLAIVDAKVKDRGEGATLYFP